MVVGKRASIGKSAAKRGVREGEYKHGRGKKTKTQEKGDEQLDFSNGYQCLYSASVTKRGVNRKRQQKKFKKHKIILGS